MAYIKLHARWKNSLDLSEKARQINPKGNISLSGQEKQAKKESPSFSFKKKKWLAIACIGCIYPINFILCLYKELFNNHAFAFPLCKLVQSCGRKEYDAEKKKEKASAGCSNRRFSAKEKTTLNPESPSPPKLLSMPKYFPTLLYPSPNLDSKGAP